MKFIDWHAGFVAAMKLDLIENEKDLVYNDEQTVANRAQRLDLLIIKNENGAKIINPIGAMFGKYNICEYKNPKEVLNYEAFFKTLAYTCLYLYESRQAHYTVADYTMTFVREPYPRELFKQLQLDGISITPVIPGIYNIKNNLPFRTQVIVTKEISNEYGAWLRCLTKHGTEDNLENIIKKTPTLVGHNKDNADVVMNIFTASNRGLIDRKMKEDPDMCEAVNELFADQIKEKDIIITNLQNKLHSLEIENSATINALKAEHDELLSIIADLQAKLAQKSSDPI